MSLENKYIETEKTIDKLLDNRIVKISLIAAACVGALYVSGRLFSVIGNTILSYKSMRDAFNK
jgi:hypothetical protein